MSPAASAPGRVRKALALYLQPRLLIIFFMGFASGLPLALSSATLFFWLAEAGVALAAIGLFALVGTPYNFKFLWAPLIDRVPLPILTRRLGRRRSWMLLIQVMLLLAIAVLGFSRPETAPLVAAVCALAVAFMSASQDIVIDAYRIEILDADEQGAGAAMTQAGYRLGAIAAGAGALFLAEQLDWSLVYLVMAALVTVGMLAALLAPDPDRRNPEIAASRGEIRLRTMVVDPFVEFFQRNGFTTALIILAFILLYKLGDAYAGVMAYPFYYEMGFSKSEVATVSKIFGVVATVVGVFVGGLIVKRFGIMPSLLGCGILQMLSNLMYAAHPVRAVHVFHGLRAHAAVGIQRLDGGAHRLVRLLRHFDAGRTARTAAVIVDDAQPADVEAVESCGGCANSNPGRTTLKPIGLEIMSGRRGLLGRRLGLLWP
jgi:PAT family beta-lactamase induction signal transducer AmpG